MPSDDIARIVASFSPNTTIQSAQMNSELNQLITTMNTKFGRGVSQNVTGNNTFTGNNIFSGSNTFSGSTPFSNMNIATGLDPMSSDGSEWYNSTTKVFKAQEQGLIVTAGIVAGINEQSGATYTALATDRGATVVHNCPTSVTHTLPQAGTTGFTDKFRYTVANIGTGYVVITPVSSTIDNGTLLLVPPGQSVTLQSNDSNYFTEKGLTSYPTGYHGSASPVWASASTITFQYIRERDSTDSVNIVQNTPLTVNGANLGLNGLDAGTTGDNQWIYFYAVTNGIQSGVMASLINEWATGSISGANFAYTYKRQLKFAIPTDGSGNMMPFVCTGNNVIYSTPMTNVTGSNAFSAASITNVLYLGTSSTGVILDVSSFVPPFSTIIDISVCIDNGSMYIYEPSTTNYLTFAILPNTNNVVGSGIMPGLIINNSQEIEYKMNTTAGRGIIDIKGFTINSDF